MAREEIILDYSKLEERVIGNEPGNILAELFRQICRDAEIIPYMDLLVQERLHDLNEGLTKKKRTVGPIKSEILSDNMTWAVFLKLMLEVLKVDDINFITHIRLDGKMSTGSVVPRINIKKRR